MGKKKLVKKGKKMNSLPQNMKEPLWTWVFQSSKPRAGGMRAQYVTQLNEDGQLSCTCPGWCMFKAKVGYRTCKHCRLIEVESKDIFKKWKNGEPLPMKLEEQPQATTIVTGPGSAAPKFSRVIELD